VSIFLIGISPVAWVFIGFSLLEPSGFHFRSIFTWQDFYVRARVCVCVWQDLNELAGYNLFSFIASKWSG